MNQTIQIETGKELRFENVASFRKKMRQLEIQAEVEKFVQSLKDGGAKKNGPMISATFVAEEIDGDQVLDMEFLFPVDRKVDLPQEYQWKPVFHLVNAVYTRHAGNPTDLQNTYTELMTYIQENQLHQITVAYNVNVNDDKVGRGNEPIIDIYVGMNLCIL
ncbi:MAG: hypothetical protein JWM44_2560 [Bacilli bacterium]|nr:hypothetical protein [Bacilli bacterium]